MTSAFLDLETLSRRPDAIITEIALISVDTAAPYQPIIDELVLLPCIVAQLLEGRHHDQETLAWHRKQGTLPLPDTKRQDLNTTAFLIRDFFKKHQPERVWIQGPDFDRPILESFLKLCGNQPGGEPLPWQYWQVRDARTAWKLAYGEEKPAKRPHSALADAHLTRAATMAALTELGRLSAL